MTLKLFVLFVLLPGSAYASSQCEIGDESKGYWAMVGAPYQGSCKIPGPPDFIGNKGTYGYRVEGNYKIVSGLTGKGFYRYQPTCEPECLTGKAELHCKEAYGPYGYEADGQNCISPDSNNDGEPDQYACFTDANYLTLYEWKWYSDECNFTEKPNEVPGKPCPRVPVG